MKYKQCPNCGRFNNKIESECSCGFDISEIYDFEELSDEELQKNNDNPTRPIEVEEKQLEPKKTMIECPSCGAMNELNAFSCKDCGEKLVEEKKDNEGKISFKEENFIRNEDSKKTTLANELNFNVLYNNQVFSFIANGNALSFGRNSISTSSFNEDKYISRQHFNYYYKNGFLYIIDVSTNGTSVNGQRLLKNLPTLIKDGDLITLYKKVIQIKYVR